MEIRTRFGLLKSIDNYILHISKQLFNLGIKYQKMQMNDKRNFIKNNLLIHKDNFLIMKHTTYLK